MKLGCINQLPDDWFNIWLITPMKFRRNGSHCNMSFAQIKFSLICDKIV